MAGRSLLKVATALLAYPLVTGSGVPSEALIRVSIVRADLAQGVACDLTAVPQAYGGNEDRAPLRIPRGAGRFPLPPGTWILKAECEGLWGAPQVVSVSPGAAVRELSIAVWETGHLVVPFEPEKGAPLPGPAVAVFATPEAMGDQGRISESTVMCELGRAAWTCRLPATKLDVQLRCQPFLALYLPATEIERGRSIRVPPQRLRRGASVVGRVARAPHDRRAWSITVLVAPDVADPVQSPPSDPRFSTSARDGGFFQLGPLPPAAYYLQARAQAPDGNTWVSESHLVDVPADTEVQVKQPLILREPALLRVRVSPPLRPNGENWSVTLLAVGGSSRPTLVARHRPLSAEGELTVENLPTGSYRVQVGTVDRSVWAQQLVDLAPGASEASLEIPIRRVRGSVRVGDSPVPNASVTLFQKEGIQIKTKTDENGEFRDLVPLHDERPAWGAVVESGSPRMRRMVQDVQASGLDSDDLVLDVRLPDGRIEGRILAEDGRPWRDHAFVRATGLTPGASVLGEMGLGPSDEGSFRLEGLSEGSYLLSAEGAGTESDTAVAELDEDSRTSDVVLRMLKKASVLGRVIGPEGIGVPGASVTVATPRAAFASETRTDGQGLFRAEVSSAERTIILSVGAIGFARRLIRAQRAPDDQVLAVSLSREGGTLILEPPTLQDPSEGPVSICSDGAFEGLPGFLRWAAQHTSGQADARLMIPMMQPGAYEACRGGPPRACAGSFSASLESCVSGTLTPGGELTLRLPSVKATPPPSNR